MQASSVRIEHSKLSHSKFFLSQFCFNFHLILSKFCSNFAIICLHFSILTNAQSPGIVNRLMRYYEESQSDSEKNRYVYNKVGDFPIVQLKKNVIKRNLVKSPSVRIAPPSRTIMNRDIRAAIMRSNSFQLGSNVSKLLPTKMIAKDDSHQIILNHEPTTESPQSAKSVLDALEKNCRKRINNEELTLDRNKRVCAPHEVVDAPSRDFIPIAQTSGKRGRDDISPGKTNGDSPNSQLRKKLRIRNNALLSSLSSSTFLVKPFNLTPSLSLPQFTSSSVPSQQTKTLNDIKQVEQQLKKVDVEAQTDKSPPKPEPVKKLHLFNRKIDPATFRPSIVTDDDDEVKINFVKPRETKSNYNIDIVRHVEKEKLEMMLSGLSDGFKSPTKEVSNDLVDSVPASISFTTSTTTSTVAPISSPTSSSISLLPLNVATTSSISLLAPAAKAVEAPVSTSASMTETFKPREIVKSLPIIQFGITTPNTTVVTTSSTLPAALAVGPVTSTPALQAALFNTPKPSTETSTAPVDQSKSLITFTPISKNMGAPITQPAVTSSSSQPINSVAPSITIMSKSDFSFGNNKEPAKTSTDFSFGMNMNTSSLSANAKPVVPVNPIVTTTSSLAITSPPSFSFQAPATKTFSFGAKPAAVTTTAAPVSVLNTGMQSSFANVPGALTNTVSFLEKPVTTKASGIGFSFSNTTSVAPVVPTTSPGLGFSFGSSQAVSNPLPAPATTTSSQFSFGGSSTSSVFGQQQSQLAPQQNQPAPQQSGFPSFTQKTEAPSSGMFSFGQKTAASVPAQVTTAQSFFSGSNQTSTMQQQSGFGFGQSNTVQPTPVSNSGSGVFSGMGDKSAEAKQAFSFGGNNQTPQANIVSPFGNTTSNNNLNAQQSAPLFGSTGNSPFNQTSTTSNNIFGGNQPMSQSNDFGGNTKPSTGNMFAFGASNNNQQQVQTSPSGMFNFSSSTAQSNTAQASSVFGGNSGQNVSASYTFKPSTGTVVNNNPAPSVFGQNQSSSSGPPAYQFGNQIGSNTSASFTFGGASANSVQQNAPQSTGFNFNGPQTAPVAGAFNFQAQQPSLTPQPSPGGLFNIGTGGNQQRRPMRQATRRMK